MAIPRTSPVPVPVEELQQIRDRLSPQYGSQVWEGEGHRVLCIRVPREEPDPVNDLETAVEYVVPGDGRGLTHCLLLGDRRIESVYTRPFEDLMDARVAFDRDQCTALRRELDHDAHRVYTAAKDPAGLRRLAVRLPLASVQDLGDPDVERLVEHLGPDLEAERFAGVRSVYLVADADEVRLDADLFLPDLKRRYQDEARRRRLLAEAQQRRDETRRTHEEQRRRLLQDLDRRFGVRSTRAPLRRHRSGGEWEARQAPGVPTNAPAAEASPVVGAQSAPTSAPVPGTPAAVHGPPGAPVSATAPTPQDPAASLQARVDQVVATASPGAEATPGPPASPVSQAATPAPPAGTSSSVQVQEPAGQEPVVPQEPPLWTLMRTRLESAGYEVLVDPDVPGHTVHLAAEREADPQRVVVRFPGRLGLAEAEDMLRSARELGADLVLAVAEAADSEAQRRLVATKGKWLTPREAEDFGF